MLDLKHFSELVTGIGTYGRYSAFAVIDTPTSCVSSWISQATLARECLSAFFLYANKLQRISQAQHTGNCAVRSHSK